MDKYRTSNECMVLSTDTGRVPTQAVVLLTRRGTTELFYVYQYDVTVDFCSHKIISPAVVEPQTESQSKVDMNKSKQHRAAWLPEEHESFMRGLQVYGWGRWKEIARYMGNGRTNTQVSLLVTNSNSLQVI